MTIKNAEDARAMTLRNRWDIEKLLVAVQEGAAQGEYFTFVQGRLSDDLKDQLIALGFKVVFGEFDTEIKWQ